MAGREGARYLVTGRVGHSAIWTGTEMWIWGGTDGVVGDTPTGGRYSPAADSWETTATNYPVPAARHDHTAVWTGESMLVFGGSNTNGATNAFYSYESPRALYLYMRP